LPQGDGSRTSRLRTDEEVEPEACTSQQPHGTLSLNHTHSQFDDVAMAEAGARMRIGVISGG
jgi:hypothetical protein